MTKVITYFSLYTPKNQNNSSNSCSQTEHFDFDFDFVAKPLLNVLAVDSVWAVRVCLRFSQLDRLRFNDMNVPYYCTFCWTLCVAIHNVFITVTVDTAHACIYLACMPTSAMHTVPYQVKSSQVSDLAHNFSRTYIQCTLTQICGKAVAYWCALCWVLLFDYWIVLCTVQYS